MVPFKLALQGQLLDGRKRVFKKTNTRMRVLKTPACRKNVGGSSIKLSIGRQRVGAF